VTKRVEFRDDELDVVLSALHCYDLVLEDYVDCGDNDWELMHSEDKEWVLMHRKLRVIVARAEAVVRKAMK
jgi:hypothetical protein